MKPVKVAQQLAEIASKVLSARNPSRRRVAAELRRMAALVDPTPSQIFSQAAMTIGSPDEYTVPAVMAVIDKFCADRGIDSSTCEKAKRYAEAHMEANGVV